MLLPYTDKKPEGAADFVFRDQRGLAFGVLVFFCRGFLLASL